MEESCSSIWQSVGHVRRRELTGLVPRVEVRLFFRIWAWLLSSVKKTTALVYKQAPDFVPSSCSNMTSSLQKDTAEWVWRGGTWMSWPQPGRTCFTETMAWDSTFSCNSVWPSKNTSWWIVKCLQPHSEMLKAKVFKTKKSLWYYHYTAQYSPATDNVPAARKKCFCFVWQQIWNVFFLYFSSFFFFF